MARRSASQRANTVSKLPLKIVAITEENTTAAPQSIINAKNGFQRSRGPRLKNLPLFATTAKDTQMVTVKRDSTIVPPHNI